MKSYSMRVLALASIPALGACADAGSGPTGPQVKIDVAALSLPGIDEACFGITVFNGVPGDPGTDTVWSNGDVCSVQYGNGQGDITYIGPCDAGVTENNYIQLVLNTLEVDGEELSETGSPADFVNPCADPGDCVLDFECLENADVLVEFNLTVMRNAQQGFFDIAVNFEDIFCSAKLDSCYDVVAGGPATIVRSEGKFYIYSANGQNGYAIFDPSAFNEDGGWALYTLPGEELVFSQYFEGTAGVVPASLGEMLLQNRPATGRPITLLHGDSGREHTAVAAVACTAGAGETTELVMVAPTVTCDGGIKFTLDLANADGGNERASVSVGVAFPVEYTLDYAVYFGNESLACGEDADENPISCGKAYYNIAFNLEALSAQSLMNCSLSYAITATEVGSDVFTAGGEISDANGVYPGIVFGGIAMTGPAAPLCFAHGLNNDGSLVQTGYLRGDAFGGSNASNFVGDFYSSGSKAVAFDPDPIAE